MGFFANLTKNVCQIPAEELAAAIKESAGAAGATILKKAEAALEEGEGVQDAAKGLADAVTAEESIGKCIESLLLNFWRPCPYHNTKYDDTILKGFCGAFGQKTHYIGLTVAIGAWFLLLLLIIAIIGCIVNSCRERD